MDRIQTMILNDHLNRLCQIGVAEANSDEAYRRLQLAREFFFTVFEVSKEEHLLHILSNPWGLAQHYYLYFYSFPELDSQQLINHRNTYQACHNRNAKAPISAFRIG